MSLIQEDARKILKQAGVKERMMAFELATLQDDFYKTIKDFLSTLQGEDRQQMESVFNSIVMSRKSKIAKLAEAVTEDPEIQNKLTSEEKDYFESISSATKLFKDRVLS